MSLDVLSCVARPVFLLLIYADCDGNTASFPFPGKMGRTFCATISSTFPWPRTGTATTKAPITIAKFSFDFIARFLLLRRSLQCCCSRAPSNTSVKRCVHERAAAGEESANPQWVGQHATRVRYSNPSVTFSVALFIIWA